MANVGSLVVELSANIAKFQSDMGKAAEVAESNLQKIDKSVGVIKNSLIVLGAGFVSTLAFDAIKGKIEGVIAAAADLEKLSARTGATVEALSGLAAVAKFSGTDTDALATGLQKLSKSMVDAENGGKKTSASFEAIGISAQDLKGKSPEETFLLLAKQLDKYQDGAGKTVIAQNLMGKSGANLLPVLKDLNTVGEYVTKTNTEQARTAKEYEDNLMRLQAASNAVYKTIAFAVLPTLNDLVLEMVDVQKKTDGVNGAAKNLAADHSIRDWAQEAAIAAAYVIESFQAIAKTILAVGGSIQVVLADMKLSKVNNDAELNDVNFKLGIPGAVKTSTEKLQAALDERNKVLKDANDRYKDLWNFDSRAIEKSLNARFAGSNATADWAANADPRDAKIRKAAEDRAKKPEVPTSGLGNENAYKGPKDDPAKKLLEGQLKAQESLIAEEKSQLSTQAQYLSYYYQAEYLTTSAFYSKKKELIQDGLKVEIAAYDKETAAIQAYMAQTTREVDLQDSRNKLADVTVKRKAAELAASKALTDVVLEQMRVYRDFELQTVSIAHQAKLNNDQAQFAIDLMGKGTLEILKQTAAKQIDLALEQRIYDIKKKAGNDDAQANKLIAEATAEAEAQKLAALDLVQKAYDKQRSAAFGASEAVRKYTEEAADNATQIEGVLSNAFKGAEDALVNFITHGKLDFKSLADSIIADLVRMAVKQQIIAPLANSLGLSQSGSGSAGGGLFGSLGKLLGGIGGASGGAASTGLGAATASDVAAAGDGLMFLAGGGDLSLNTPTIVGEKGPELYVPTSAGHIYPNEALQGMGGSAANQTHINLTMNVPKGTDTKTAGQWGAEAARQLRMSQARYS